MKQSSISANVAAVLPPCSGGPRAPIQKKTILSQLDEALKWATELDKHLAGIQEKLSFRAPEAENEVAQRSVEEKVSDLSTRLASMCGFASTIEQRIGEM